MIRRDYILRMIEEFMQVISRIQALKKGQHWGEAAGGLDDAFKRLIGGGADTVAKLSETELLAKLIQGDPTQAVREKSLILTTLLNEAGDVAAAQNRADDSRRYYLKGLHLLLATLAHEDAFAFPEFVPKVEMFLSALQDAPLPLNTSALLMQHYERSGQFGRAEDTLFAMLDLEPDNRAVVDFGLAFLERLQNQSDASLMAGNLPRPELEAGLLELRNWKSARR